MSLRKRAFYGAERMTTGRISAPTLTANSFVAIGRAGGLPVACVAFSKGNRHHEEKAQRTT